MPGYDIVLFDADNTLYDFHRAEHEALKVTLKRYGLPLTEEVNRLYQQINTRLWAEFEAGRIEKSEIQTRFAMLFRAFSVEGDGEQCNRDYLDALGDGTFLMPQALEVCRALAPGVTLYLATNGVSRTQRRRVEQSELKEYLSGVFVSEDAGVPKPHRGYFDYLFQHIGNPDKHRVLMVGDSLATDIRGGADYGLDTCWYNPAGLPLTGAVQPQYEIRTLTELIPVVKG